MNKHWRWIPRSTQSPAQWKNIAHYHLSSIPNYWNRKENRTTANCKVSATKHPLPVKRYESFAGRNIQRLLLRRGISPTAGILPLRNRINSRYLSWGYHICFFPAKDQEAASRLITLRFRFCNKPSHETFAFIQDVMFLCVVQSRYLSKIILHHPLMIA